MLQYNWEKLTSSEFDEAIEKSKGLCIIPLGCMERHGEHIAVGCDTIQAKTFANAVAEKEYAVVFPETMWLGDVMGAHALTGEMLETPYKKRGFIAPSLRLMLDILTELCEEIHRNGFRKILILNCHGGNTAMLNSFIRAFCYEKKDCAVMWMSAYPPDEYVFGKLYNEMLKRPEDFPKLNDDEMALVKRFGETGIGGGHGDIRETAICMSKNPESVRMDRCNDCPNQSVHKADYLAEVGVFHGQSWGANFPHALSGYSSEGCTQAIGEALLTYCTERLVKAVKVLKDDEKCVMMSQRKPF